MKDHFGADTSSPGWDDVGSIMALGDGIARVYGCETSMAGELLEFSDGTLGLALNLEGGFLGAVRFSAAFGESDWTEGALVRTTKEIANVKVSASVRGRILNGLAGLIDGKGPMEHNSLEQRCVESRAPGIMDRKSVHEPFATGVTAIDAMIPIGRGQRELIIGDRQTGKTTVSVDAIRNQNEVVWVYVAIGQKMSTWAEMIRSLAETKDMSGVVIVLSGADEASTLQFLAPYSGATIAEYFMYDGWSTWSVYDDLTKHAVAYREMWLLLRRPPAREAYPGDVFYLHARLLERGAKLSDRLGGGSMTALPIIETLEGDVSAYIPTNVISITDGQLFFSSSLFNEGLRPAINVGISVSRVGSAAQPKLVKQVSGQLKLQLAQFSELQAFAQFASDLDAATQAMLAKGIRLRELLKQPPGNPYTVMQQVALVYLGTRMNEWLDIAIENIERVKDSVLATMITDDTSCTASLGSIDNELRTKLQKVIKSLNK